MYIDILTERLVKDKNIVSGVKQLKSEEDKISTLIDAGYSKDFIINSFENYFGVEYINLQDLIISKEIIEEFDINTLREKRVVPYDIDKQNKVYHLSSSHLQHKQEVLDVEENMRKKGYKCIFKFSFDFEIDNKLNELSSGVVFEESDRENEDIDIIAWVDNVMKEGIRRGASDIHIETKEGKASIRYRVDGVITDAKVFSMTEQELSRLVVRVKTMSDMNITEKRKPQDGRIGDYLVDDNVYDLRTSTVNTISGEKMVMRIINKEAKILKFNEIGFNDKDIAKIKNALNNPNGIIYIGGATGSGKTSTLYTMIGYKDTVDKNIYTIENPVEKQIPSINQIQIDEEAGINYANTLRALLRQDPDIMVVGEIRDKETAELALNASLAGHLILTTIHANNAINILNRLSEIGLQPNMVSSTSLLLMSQRLMRKLCDECKELAPLTDDEKIWLDNLIKFNPEFEKEIRDVFYRPVGCSKCNNGYSGRFAIAELIEVTPTIAKLISDGQASLLEIENQAIKEGLTTFRVSAFNNVLNGATSIEEAIRVVN